MEGDENEERRRNERLAITRIVLRPTGTPLPLAFMALAVATVGFSAVQLGFIPKSEESTVALAVLVLTVPLQFLSCIIGFGARDPIAGTGMAMVAGVWAMIGVSSLMTPEQTPSPGLGVLLITAAVAILVPVAAAHAKLVAAAVLGGSAIRFAVTGISELTGSPGWEVVAGILGLMLAVVALYAALGFEVEEVDGPVQLPLMRRGAGAKPLVDDMGEQVEGIAREAGVRHQL
ncbi:acetate uptake transporter family protein [Arthrobacter pigmenti]